MSRFWTVFVTVLAGGLPAGAQTCGWDQKQDPGPSGRTGARMVFDQARGVAVLYGGINGSEGFEDTWTWDGASWTLAATTGPAPRALFGMCYDSIRNVTLLYGDPEDNRTWKWDGTAWSAAAPAASGPVPTRADAAMAFDSGRGVAVLFGGLFGHAGLAGDTWEWDGASWTQRATTGPAPRYRAEMAYDESRHVCVLFGGNRLFALSTNDTWEWDGSVWVQRFPADAPRPQWGHRMTYDPHRRRVLLFDGIATGPLATTWEYDGTNWSQAPATGPMARSDAALTYDRLRGETVLFGGRQTNGPLYFADTWLLRCGGCYANCDGSTSAPVLNVNDFVCFGTRFAAGDSYANCDGSAEPPVLNVNDYVCFLARFADGCP
jgi:hypothetical protein